MCIWEKQRYLTTKKKRNSRKITQDILMIVTIKTIIKLTYSSLPFTKHFHTYYFIRDLQHSCEWAFYFLNYTVEKIKL